MKSRILNRLVILTFLTLVVSCKPKTEQVLVDKEQLKIEIQAMENKMAELFNDRNVNSEEYYADDAISFSQDKPPMVGKSAIRKSLKEDLEKFPTGYQIAFVVNEVIPSNDGVQVVEIGNYRVSDSTDTALYTGNFIAVFEKRDGKFVCVRDMSASNRPKLESKAADKKE